MQDEKNLCMRIVKIKRIKIAKSLIIALVDARAYFIHKKIYLTSIDLHIFPLGFTFLYRLLCIREKKTHTKEYLEKNILAY